MIVTNTYNYNELFYYLFFIVKYTLKQIYFIYFNYKYFNLKNIILQFLNKITKFIVLFSLFKNPFKPYIYLY